MADKSTRLMGNRLKSPLRRLGNKLSSLSTQQIRVLAVVAFAAVGTVVLIQSYGAALTAQLQAENGTVSGAVKKTDDTSASGGGYVVFGAAQQTVQRLEAEAANHNVAVETAGKEYASGGAVLGFFGNQGKFVEFTVNMNSAGSYGVSLRYAAADGTATQLNPLPRTLIVNGSNQGNVDFPRTSATANNWNSLTTQSLGNLNLIAGNNTIRLQIDTTQEGYWDVDYLEVAGAGNPTPPPPPPPPAPTPPPPPPGSGTYTPPNGLPGISIPTNAKFVSPSGSDSNPGTDSAPYQSIRHGINQLNAGDTLVIKAGNYTISNGVDASGDGAYMPILNKNGNANAWIKIVGDPRGARPRIYIPWDGGSWQGFYPRFSSYVQIQYLEVYSNADTVQGKVSGVYIRDSHHIRIYDIWSHHGGGCGICASASNHVEIRGNLIWSNSRWNEYNTSGISLIGVSGAGGGAAADGYTNWVVGNMLWDNEALVTFIAAPQWGITDGNCIIMDVSSQSGRTLLANNICVDNGGKGLHAVHYNNADYLSNTSYHNVRSNAFSVGNSAELTAQEATSINFRDNVVWPRPSKAGRFIDIINATSDVSGNAWVGGSAGGGFQVGTDVITNPQLDPRNGNWTIRGAAAGKGAPWPLKATYPN